MQDLATAITNYLSKLKAALGYNFAKTSITIDNKLKSKVDLKTINELLLFEYANKLLSNLQAELEALYLTKRKQEASLKILHTPEHQAIIEARFCQN